MSMNRHKLEVSFKSSVTPIGVFNQFVEKRKKKGVTLLN